MRTLLVLLPMCIVVLLPSCKGVPIDHHIDIVGLDKLDPLKLEQIRKDRDRIAELERALAKALAGERIDPPKQYKWRYIAKGDIAYHDMKPETAGRTPDPSRCKEATLGHGVVCPNNRDVCCYKDVHVNQMVPRKSGGNPGAVYKCVYE